MNSSNDKLFELKGLDSFPDTKENASAGKDAFAPPEFERALKSALNILDYADNTEKKLREKLARKGHSPEAVEYAISYVKERHFLDDRRFIAHAAERIANGKLYGRRRVIEELYAKGFARADIEELVFDDVDFAANCAERIRRFGGRYGDTEKLKHALLRYGFCWDDIRSGFELLRIEREEKETDEQD